MTKEELQKMPDEKLRQAWDSVKEGLPGGLQQGPGETGPEGVFVQLPENIGGFVVVHTDGTWSLWKSGKPATVVGRDLHDLAEYLTCRQQGRE